MRQAQTEADGATIQERSIFGGEAKTLPYLLAQLNLLLHGVHAPRIDPGNTLRHRLTEIGEDQRVAVILTNPPFGGEEEAGILNNFPDDRRTAETALLFLQVIMRRLKRGGRGHAAVVVPNGTLFGDGIAARIKADLLERFNLHTIVRLPEGVFAPYTDIPVNLVFFDTSGPTRSIWYYEQPRPEGRRKYSKTAPLAWEELAPCLAWWKEREVNERAWQVDATGLIRRDDAGRVVGCNLDVKNPYAEEVEDHRTSGEIVDAIIARERRVLEIMDEIKETLVDLRNAFDDAIEDADYLPMAKVAPLVRRPVDVQPDKSYPELGVRSFGRGTFHKPALDGVAVGNKKLYRIAARDLVFNIVFAWE